MEDYVEIHTVVFDLGNVLLEYLPKKWLRRRHGEEMAGKLEHIIFRSVEWVLLDKGEMDVCSAVASMCKKHPAYEKAIRDEMARYTDMFVPITQTVALLRTLSEKNVRLYYLSDFHREAFKLVQSRNAFFQYFDGGLISATCNLLKPDLRIYQTLEKMVGIEGAHTLFLDDIKENVEGAKRAGWHGLTFCDAQDVKKQWNRDKWGEFI